MRFCSTQNPRLRVSFLEALTHGVPPDGGLYLPAEIPVCADAFLRALPEMPFPEIALGVARLLLGDEIADADLKRIVREAITFDAPLVYLDERTAVLELFHGPTLAFKDFGARFLAQTMAHVYRGKEYTVLVATSGDTGSAVAHAFHGMHGVHVALLYPSGRVSPLQERQLRAFGGNVTALEVDGTFDDCQRLVKMAFADPEIATRRNLTSANSINVARLLPQTFYYFNAVARARTRGRDIVFSVPSGNLGNLTAGIIASRMRLRAKRFLAAANANDVFRRYVTTGVVEPRSAISTISNAMDVGDPGNLPRIRALFGDDLESLRGVISSSSSSDDETREGIARARAAHGYLFDPHGAVAYVALARHRKAHGGAYTGIVLATAHPAKFPDVYPEEVRASLEVPQRFREMLEGEGRTVKIPAEFGSLKSVLIGLKR